MLPEGLTADGLGVVRSAKNAGVDVDLVNLMAMDYGRAGQDYGDLAIQADARDLVAHANAEHLGFVSLWEAHRDRNACSGALFQCTDVSQTSFEFTRILAGFKG